jgi:hypothetical protein
VFEEQLIASVLSSTETAVTRLYFVVRKFGDVPVVELVF